MILVVSGGVDAASVNTRLAQFVQTYIENQGEAVECICLADYDVPLLVPGKNPTPTEELVALRTKFEKASGFFLSTPEYNGNIPPVLSNMLNSLFNFMYFPESPTGPLQNKPVLVSSASPSVYGGMKAASILNAMLLQMGAVICPHGVSVSQAFDAFEEDGMALKNPQVEKQFKKGLDLLMALSSSKLT